MRNRADEDSRKMLYTFIAVAAFMAVLAWLNYAEGAFRWGVINERVTAEQVLRPIVHMDSLDTHRAAFTTASTFAIADSSGADSTVIYETFKRNSIYLTVVSPGDSVAWKLYLHSGLARDDSTSGIDMALLDSLTITTAGVTVWHFDTLYTKMGPHWFLGLAGEGGSGDGNTATGYVARDRY